MPNFCENVLTLHGCDSLIQQFIQENTTTTEEGVTLDFTKSLPIGANASTTNADTLWGTKWNAIYVDPFDVTSNSIQFDTAWSPPLAWLRGVAARYAHIKFSLKYEEPNDGYQGSYEIHVAEGINIADEWEYNANNDSGDENDMETLCA